MTLKFYQYGADRLVATLELDEAHSSIIDKLNEPTRLSATLTSDTAPALKLGARTTYKGVTYYVTKEPTLRKEHSKLYTIEAELETVIGLARHVILDNPVDKRSSFDYTATATEHIQLVVDSLNGKKLRKIPAWTRGLILASDTVKHIKYDGISAWDALQLIRQTYETDLHIDGTAISLGIWGNKNNAIELAYGKGNGILSGLERIKHDDTPTPMSLYVTGTKRNMPKGRLTMQQLETLKVDDDGNILHGDSASGRIFSTDKTGQYISEFTHDNGEQPLYTEATYTNEEIYPSHVSTIRSVTKVKDHYEVNSDFDYSKLLIAGEQMQVVFQSGNLAGRDFDAKYFTSSGRLAIVPKEEDDTTLPNDILCPKVGDQYIVTGIKLPDKYIREAQRKLTKEALRHLLKLQQQRYSYKAEIDPVYLHNHKTTIGTKLDVGQYVHLTDQQIAVGDPYIRIIAKRTYLDRPHTPEVELSNEVERLSLFDRLIRDTSGVLADREVILGRLTASSAALDNLTLASTDLTERLKIAEESVQSHGKTLSGQAQALASQAQLLADQGQQLTTQGESLSSQSQRLATAEQALTDKLDSGAFAQWQAGDYSQRQSALDKALASKQPAGSYALTSQLATSQQQAVAEAVKQAEEMDKQIKVGGRNLLRAGYFEKVCFGSDTSKSLTIDDKEKKITIVAKDTWNSWSFLNNIAAYTTIDLKKELGEYTFSFSVRGRGTFEFGVDADFPNEAGESKVIRTITEDWQRVSVSFKRTIEASTLFYAQSPNRDYGVVGDWVQFADDWKLERGSIATDWTPAPEDVEESVSKVNTSVTSLTSLLESHKTATDKSFAELSDHPLTVDKDGYWQIWSVKDSKYLTTQYPSRGRDGQNGAKGDKGDKPVIRWDGTKLLIDDLQAVDLRGQRGETGARGATGATGAKGDKGDKGDKPVIRWNGTQLLIDDLQAVDLRGQRGEPGHSPSPDEVLRTDSFRQRLTSEVTTQVAPVNQRLDAVDYRVNLVGSVANKATRDIDKANSRIATANDNITNLQKVALTPQQHLDFGYLTNSLQVLRSAGNNTLEGLALQRLIALSSNNETISAYLASNALPAVLKAGITNFGTANEREQVEITHQGTGHFGNLYFQGSQIDFKTGRYDAPYLSIGAEESTFIDTFISQARLDDTPVSVGTVTLSESSKVYERTVSVDNTGTRLTVVIDQLTVQLYNLARARLLLDGEELASWHGSSRISEGGGFGGAPGFKPEYTPYKGSNLSYERVVKAGSHTLRLEIAGNMASGDSGATVKGLQVRRRYDTGAQQSALTKSGLRLFASPDRYFDVDYRKTYRGSIGSFNKFTFPNPYLVRIKGGAKVDKLTADELDAPGVPLCGASFNERGGQIKAFGKYVNKRGSTRAQADYDNGMAAFKVYHSIGHTNYIPIVQVSGWASNDINWSLTPRVYNITSEYFVVRILTNNDNPTARAISYVAYKTQ